MLILIVLDSLIFETGYVYKWIITVIILAVLIIIIIFRYFVTYVLLL